MNTRTWSIRSKIVALVAVPLTALLALWIFATALTAAPALNLLSARTVLDQVSRPGENLVTELQRERRLSLIYLARDGDGAALAGQRVRTDEAAEAFEGEATSAAVRSAASGVLIGRISELVTSLRTLPSGRGLIDRRAMDNSGALALFSGVVDTAFRMFGATVTQEDPELERQTRALTGLGRAREMLGQSDALLAGALTTGRFGAGEHAQFVQIVGVQRYLYADAVAELSDADRAAYQRLAGGPAFVGLRQMQDRVVTAGRSGEPPPVDAAQWQSAYESAVQQLRDFDAGTAQALADRAAPVAMRILVRLGVAGVLGLTALLVAIVVSVRVGRSLVRRLGGLRGAALQLTKQRLPEVVARLRRGEDVDVAAETPALEYGTDEIGQLGHAFTEVQRTAVQSAVDEAALRRGLNEIFLNIARRSQALLHRQLALLDRMERRTERPDELEDLFRVDHLATRMRRHAEDLVILAGATPGRGWRNPVPFVDVIRGAVSEVEDYRRIDVTAVAGAACAGRAVGDVIHLLAELLENATSYSPPHTRVLVAGQLVPNGFAVEIEDRGLGMTPEALDDANRRLAEPPEFDPTNSARLGLFVVSRLSVRHGVRVRLRPSPYGGVTAVALIPAGLVVTTDSGPGEPPVDAHAGGPSDPSLLGPSPTVPGTLPTRTTGPVGVDGPRPVRFPATLPADPGHQRRTDPPLRSVPPLRPASLPDQPPAVTLAAALRAAATAGRARPDVAAAPAAPTGVREPAPTGVREPAGEPVGQPTPAAGDLVVGADGLPKRVRQAHLAARLRESTPGAPRPPAVSPTGERTPEQVRSMMSALQAGTARGRLAATTATAATTAATATAATTTATAGPPVGSPPPSAGEWPGAGTGAPQPPGEPPAAWRPAGRVPPTGIVVGYRTAGGDAGRRPEPSNWFAQSVVEQPAGVDGVTVAGPEHDAASGQSVGQRVPAPRAGAHDGAPAGRLAPTGVVHHGEVRTPAPGGAPSTPDAAPAPGSKVTPAAHPGTGDDSHPERDA